MVEEWRENKKERQEKKLLVRKKAKKESQKRSEEHQARPSSQRKEARFSYNREREGGLVLILQKSSPCRLQPAIHFSGLCLRVP